MSLSARRINKQTLIMMVPAPGEVLLDNVWRLILGEDAVDLVLLPPEKRLGQHLARLLDAEVTSPQKSEQSRVAWYLVIIRTLGDVQ